MRSDITSTLYVSRRPMFSLSWTTSDSRIRFNRFETCASWFWRPGSLKRVRKESLFFMASIELRNVSMMVSPPRYCSSTTLPSPTSHVLQSWSAIHWSVFSILAISTEALSDGLWTKVTMPAMPQHRRFGCMGKNTSAPCGRLPVLLAKYTSAISNDRTLAHICSTECLTLSNGLFVIFIFNWPDCILQ